MERPREPLTVREVVCGDCATRLELPSCATMTCCPGCGTRLELENVVVEHFQHMPGVATSGKLEVAEAGHLVASVRAGDVVVRGRFEGTTVAAKSVQIGRDGQVLGHVEAPRLEIEEGARLNCSVAIGERLVIDESS